MPRNIKAIAFTIAIAVAAASCTDDGPEGSPSRPPETSGSPTVSNLDRFELATEPLWRGDTAGLPEVMQFGWDSAKFIDDVLLLEGGHTPIAVVNPASGEPYWVVDLGSQVGNSDVEMSNTTGRAPIAQVGGEWVMFVTYRTGYHTEGAERERFTAAVRVKDASPLWTTPASTDTYEIMAADGQLVLLSIGGRLEQPTIQALSAANGSILWEAPGVWPQFAASNRVLGAVSSKYPGLAAEDSYVMGLDAATGQRVWSLEGRYQRSEIGRVVGNVALVYARRGAGDGEEEILLIDASTGAEISKLGFDFGGRNSCADDGARLIACTLAEKPNPPTRDSARLVTYDVAERTKHVSPPEQSGKMDERLVKKVWRDYIFVLDTSDEIDVIRAMDRDGIVVSDKFPDELIGISDEYAVFSLPERSIAAVYPLKK